MPSNISVCQQREVTRRALRQFLPSPACAFSVGSCWLFRLRSVEARSFFSPGFEVANIVEHPSAEFQIARPSTG
jgi:hypothetical protein